MVEHALSDLRRRLAVEASRLEEDCTYSMKGHYAAATTSRRVHYALGIPATVAAAVAGISAMKEVAPAAGSGGRLAILIAVGALLSSALTSISTFLNPAQKASTHETAGGAYSHLRGELRRFRDVHLHTGLTDEELVKRLNGLAQEKATLNRTSPQIPPRAFRAARRGIQEGEARHAVDEQQVIAPPARDHRPA